MRWGALASRRKSSSGWPLTSSTLSPAAESCLATSTRKAHEISDMRRTCSAALHLEGVVKPCHRPCTPATILTFLMATLARACSLEQ
eukprot:scaffold71014_cov64-Phaeocystis_antarctica.AAC.3